MDAQLRRTLRDAEADVMRHGYAVTAAEYNRLLENTGEALESLASHPRDELVGHPRTGSAPLVTHAHIPQALQDLCSVARGLMAKPVDTLGRPTAVDSKPHPNKERSVTVGQNYASPSSTLQQLIIEARQRAASLAANQPNQASTTDTPSSDPSSASIPTGILARLSDTFSKINYAKLLASRGVPYIGRASGSLEEALGQIPDRESYVLFFEDASDSRALHAMLLFNDLFLRGIPTIFVDRKLSCADYPVPPGQRLVRYIDGRVFDNSYARIPPSGVLRVITKEWVIQEMAAAEMIRTDPKKTRRRPNKDVLKVLSESMLWHDKKNDDASKVERTDITDAKRSLALINRMNAQSVMGLLSRRCQLTCLLRERACTLGWSIRTGTREIRITVAALMDMIRLIKFFYRSYQTPLNVDHIGIDFKGICLCDAILYRDVRAEFRALTRTVGQGLTHIRVIDARSCEMCVRRAMIDRKIFDQFGTDSYDRPLEHAPRMRSVTSLAVELIQSSSRTLRTLEGVSEECTLSSLTVDSLSAQLCFERSIYVFSEPIFEDCIAGLFATAGRELCIDIDRNVPRLSMEALMQERPPSKVRVLKLRQSRVSGYYQDPSNCKQLVKLVSFAMRNCPHLEEVHMTFERLYEPASTWRWVNNATLQEFAPRVLASTEALFTFYAEQIAELTPPLTAYMTFVTETPELPTTGIEHYTSTTLDDGCVVLERSEAFERGGIGACIRKKGTV